MKIFYYLEPNTLGLPDQDIYRREKESILVASKSLKDLHAVLNTWPRWRDDATVRLSSTLFPLALFNAYFEIDVGKFETME